MKIIVYGASSALMQPLIHELRNNDKVKEIVTPFKQDLNFEHVNQSILECSIDLTANYYVFANGVLFSKRIIDQTEEEITRSLNVNLISIIKISEYILEKNKQARIIIIGSESGKKGSFDTTYFIAKAALSAYVRERRISFPEQQILLVSPSVIEDAGMTTRRKDQDNVSKNRQLHPKKRLLRSEEFSKFVYELIVNEFDYITNTEIEVNGGKFARMQYQ
ncbi:hypothetical protein BCV00_17295 [Vibrio breoganii]|uniref:SDR family oxidoreductase n=1 Tax=Vibrio breoganii TaxID=553239 RepID=UPI000C867B44|nr:SDR family oxidoreductase [Vibrio breoganii]PMG02418.1 hypothetical protein BCV00_17295 [Vibrio breoganii]